MIVISNFTLTKLRNIQVLDNRAMRLFSALIIIFIMLFPMTDVHASVSKSIPYPVSFTNPLPITIPPGTSISISITYEITGSATIKTPSGSVAATIGMSGGTVTLDEIGTYTTSESYHLEATGTLSIPGQEPRTFSDDGSSQGTFSNTQVGSTGKFEVSTYFNLSVSGHSDNISVSASGTSASATTTSPIPQGGTAWANLTISWGVNTSLSIEAPPEFGTIIVNTNLEMASFTVSGPKTYNGGGTSWSVSNAPVGTYTVSFNPVGGYYTPPPSEPKTLTKDGTISFSGTYQEIPKFGNIFVNTNLDEASFSLSGPSSYSGSGTSWSMENAPSGEYTITYNPVADIIHQLQRRRH